MYDGAKKKALSIHFVTISLECEQCEKRRKKDCITMSGAFYSIMIDLDDKFRLRNVIELMRKVKHGMNILGMSSYLA
jgi:hypothetical protein